VIKEIRVFPKKIIVGPTSLWNFVPNSGFRQFCFCLSAVETCYQLSWTRLVRDKLDPTSKCDIPLHRHGPDPTKVRVLVGDPDSDKVWSGPPSGIWMTIPLSYDSRPLVYCSRLNQQGLSTARFRRAGLLATSESCIVCIASIFFTQTAVIIKFYPLTLIGKRKE